MCSDFAQSAHADRAHPFSPVRKWTRRDSNPRPLACKASDLPLIYEPEFALRADSGSETRGRATSAWRSPRSLRALRGVSRAWWARKQRRGSRIPIIRINLVKRKPILVAVETRLAPWKALRRVPRLNGLGPCLVHFVHASRGFRCSKAPRNALFE